MPCRPTIRKRNPSQYSFLLDQRSVQPYRSRCSRSGWTGLGQPDVVGENPAHNRAVGAQWTLRFLPSYFVILSQCGSMARDQSKGLLLTRLLISAHNVAIDSLHDILVSPLPFWSRLLTCLNRVPQKSIVLSNRLCAWRCMHVLVSSVLSQCWVGIFFSLCRPCFCPIYLRAELVGWL